MSKLKDKTSFEAAIAKVDDLYNELDAIRNSGLVNAEDVHSLANFQQGLFAIKYFLKDKVDGE